MVLSDGCSFTMDFLNLFKEVGIRGNWFVPSLKGTLIIVIVHICMYLFQET